MISLEPFLQAAGAGFLLGCFIPCPWCAAPPVICALAFVLLRASFGP